MTKLEIGALQALCAIQDQGGVSRAAAALALSQSAVSHKIKRLEDVLGCALLDRRTGRPRFTPEGEKLLGYARRILALHDEALHALSTEPLSGRIRLGVTEDMTSSGVSRVLGRFTRLYPAISVQISVAQSRVIAARLDRGELDAGVFQVFAADRRPDDVTLFEDSLHWVKSPDLTLDMDQPMPMLTFDEDCFYRDWALHHAPQPGAGFRIVMECASIAGMTSALRAGLGVTLLSGRHIEPGFDVVTDHFPPPPKLTYIVRTGPKARNAILMALVKIVVGEPDWQGEKSLGKTADRVESGVEAATLRFKA
ncbi:LysR family transcriptional regulator [Frigidibacter mobilis]|uniref:LysR family transcriptional regulator n=1 Tax=Frigidibacter mobilis TaxID=1335048 RepID=A0A159Z0K7_9RHOB|nr:LysR family transcriptional regulator [Frigidibacter mobilis]AMY67438.1 LysR family transcriptional regulator [Frigidibacter mobilis]